jgi:Pathogenicity locus
MSPSKVIRENVAALTDLPNIGQASAADLRLLGIDEPSKLKGRDPYEMYETLCRKTKLRHDPCVIDVFISVTRFMNGEPPRAWWAFTEERKRVLSDSSRDRLPNAPR